MKVEFRSKLLEGSAENWCNYGIVFCDSLVSDWNWIICFSYCGWIVVLWVYSFWGFLGHAENHCWSVGKENFIIIGTWKFGRLFHCVLRTIWRERNSRRLEVLTFDGLEWPIHIIKQMMLQSLYERITVLSSIPSSFFM